MKNEQQVGEARRESVAALEEPYDHKHSEAEGEKKHHGLLGKLLHRHKDKDGGEEATHDQTTSPEQTHEKIVAPAGSIGGIDPDSENNGSERNKLHKVRKVWLNPHKRGLTS